MTPADWSLYSYRGKLVRVIDGDTAEIAIDLGLRITATVRVRLVGYNAPELNAEGGAQARRELEECLKDEILYIQTVKDRKSFDRYLARIYVELPPGAPLVDVAALMRGIEVSAKARKPMSKGKAR